LLKAANSAYFSLKRKAETVEQAISFIGMRQCGAVLLGLVARKSISAEGAMLTRFWDVSDKRAMAMSLLAKQMKISTPDTAHTFGLFCDIGIPLLMQRFPDYSETLQLANNSTDERFTAIEDRRHNTNHATIGSLLSKNWGLSADIAFAIRLHHDYEVIAEEVTPDNIKGLVALSLVVEKAIQTYQNKNTHAEWDKGGALALTALGINEDEFHDICEELHARFDALV
jgi:HD-like signal output (HDOD) protein